MALAIVAVGSNINDRLKNISEAITRLAEFGKISATSAIYETPPVGYENQANFLNAAATLQTDMQPLELLSKLQSIELELGRVREFKNGPRTIDLDLIFFDAQKIDSPELTLPHPRWRERDFVITPLIDLLEKNALDGDSFKELRTFLSTQTRKFKPL